MAARNRLCVFCGSELATARSREHVFPQWLLRHLGASSRQVEPTYMIIDEGQVKDVRHSTYGDLLEGRICAGCNNGWMSRLENDIRQVLVDLAEGRRLARQLSDEQRILLTRWAAKTVYVLNSSSNFPLKVPAEHLRVLAENGQPVDGVFLYCTQSDSEVPLGFVQGPIWLTVSESEALSRFDELAHDSYKISLKIGRLLMLVAYWPDRRWQHILVPGVHDRVWPRGGARLVRPAPIPLWGVKEALRLSLFHWSLGIANTSVFTARLQLRGAVGWPPDGFQEETGPSGKPNH